MLLPILLRSAAALVTCSGAPTGSLCPAENTCIMSQGGEFIGCCPVENATACGARRCCPPGAACAGNRCLLPGTPPPPPADKPIPMSSGAWQPAWNICRPPPGTLSAPATLDVVPRGARAALQPLTIPVYSSIKSAQIERLADPDVTVALIMQHGAVRNADDYFCAGVEAARLWTAAAAHHGDKVLVLAPRFMEEADGPPRGTLWWNGTEARAAGEWRGGSDSDARSDPSGEGRTASSFAALDALVEALLDRRAAGALPQLRRIVLAGHSSGGQIVQRHALFSRLDPRDTPAVELRHCAANPSSYCALDAKRVSRGGDIVVPPRNVTEQCPAYNAWIWGISPAPWPLPPRCAAYVGGVPSALRDFARRSVVYVQGGNDTCACNQARGGTTAHAGGAAPSEVCTCESHGLETTCADELNGAYRLERGFNYWATLGAVYGGKQPSSHSLVVVPDVGHDHVSEQRCTARYLAVITPPPRLHSHTPPPAPSPLFFCDSALNFRP